MIWEVYHANQVHRVEAPTALEAVTHWAAASITSLAHLRAVTVTVKAPQTADTQDYVIQFFSDGFLAAPYGSPFLDLFGG